MYNNNSSRPNISLEGIQRQGIKRYNDSLYNAYRDARDAYWEYINETANPPCFDTVFNYFYWANHEIRSFEFIPAQAGGARRTNRMTPRNQKYYFEWANLQYTQCKALDDFMFALSELLSKTHYNSQSVTLCRKRAALYRSLGKQLPPGELSTLETKIHRTPDSSFILAPPSQINPSQIDVHLITKDLLNRNLPKRHLPWGLLQKYFKELSQASRFQQNLDAFLYVKNPSQYTNDSNPLISNVDFSPDTNDQDAPDTPSLFFRYHGLIREVCYNPSADKCFDDRFLKIYHSTKYVRVYRPSSSHAEIPEHLGHILYLLTGGNTPAVDMLARVFYQIIAPYPVGPRATILYSPTYAGALRDLFQIVFSHMEARLPRQPASINRLTMLPYLQTLVNEQLSGRAFCILSDHPISRSAQRTAQALVHGKKVAIKDPCLTFQRFRNHIHLLIPTANQERALQLSRLLKIRVLDFSKFELPGQDFSFPHKEQIDWERNWMLSNFLLYGLKVSTQPTTEPPCSMCTDYIASFLKACCTFHEGAMCSGLELYQAYCDYHEIQSGAAPTILCRPFVRLVQEFYARETRLSYRKTRRAGDKNPRAYFCGLHLSPPPPAEKHPVEPEEDFRNFLRAMTFLGDNLEIPPLLKVHLEGGAL